MAEMVRVKLLKKLYRNVVGDVIAVRSHEARALIAVGAAEQYIESRRKATATPAVTPVVPELTQPVTSPGNPTEITEAIGGATEPTGAFGNEPYARRDMKPEE